MMPRIGSRPHQHVLVVDDDPMILRLVEARLHGLGIKLTCEPDAGRVLDWVRREKPDLILLDVNMPGLTGFDVIRQLKLDPSTYTIPVIFLTGMDEQTDKVKGFDLGAVDYVIKPFDPAELRARVRAALQTKALMDMLTTQAQIDGLTGLHNRRFFDSQIDIEMDAGRRYQHKVGLVMIDIDRFKAINDRHGHPKGDQVLKQVAAIITDACRSSDHPCRYGGEEFAVLLPESTPQRTLQAGKRFHTEIRGSKELISLLGRSVTVSVGTACIDPLIHPTAGTLIDKADRAMYAAKQAGRDRVEDGYLLAG